MDDIDGYLKDNIESVFSKRNYQNIVIQLESGSKEGDGYAASIIRAVVSAEKNGIKEVTDTIVKCAPKKQKNRKYMSTTAYFNREILYYTEIAPVYKKIQHEFKIQEEMRFEIPKCFASSNLYYNEFVILENLKAKDYIMMEGKPLNYEHAKVAMNLLGKLHALSFIFEIQNQKQFYYLTPQLVDTMFASTSEYDASGLFNIVEKSFHKYLNCIENQNYKERVMHAIGDSLTERNQSLLVSGKKKVISHGDFWINNVLFKYQDNKPIGAILIDFQNCRYSSLANDFYCLVALSSEGELRREHFWQLADDYYKSLAEFLSSCGYNVDSFCTYQEFQQELRDQALYGLAMNIIVLPLFTADVVWEIPEVLSGNIPNDFLTTSDVFKTRANDMVNDWVHFGFLK